MDQSFINKALQFDGCSSKTSQCQNKNDLLLFLISEVVLYIRSGTTKPIQSNQFIRHPLCFLISDNTWKIW